MDLKLLGPSFSPGFLRDFARETHTSLHILNFEENTL
jgi:hypothetical protein